MTKLRDNILVTSQRPIPSITSSPSILSTGSSEETVVSFREIIKFI